MSSYQNPTRLNEAQMLLLQLFQNRNMNESEISTLRDTLVQHLSNELDTEIKEVMLAKEIDISDINKNVKLLNKNRTQHKNTMRVI